VDVCPPLPFELCHVKDNDKPLSVEQ
jgi:hypothetical protein